MRTFNFSKIAIIAVISFLSLHAFAVEPVKKESRAAVASAVSCPNTVMIIRHGEKPISGANLTQIGWTRAYALPGVFNDSRKPSFVAAAQDSSDRPIQTCTPIALSVGQGAPWSGFAVGQEQAMAQYILTNPNHDPKIANGTVLICWEHDHIPALVSDFGGSLGKWPKYDFDTIVTLKFAVKNNVCTYQGMSISNEDLVARLQSYAVNPNSSSPTWKGPTYNMPSSANNYSALMCENPSNPWQPQC